MNKFICAILVLIFIAFSYADDADEKIQALQLKLKNDLEMCTNKTGITQDQFKDVIYFQIPKERAPMCFLACLAKEFNLMDANNKFTKAGINKLMEPVLIKLKEAGEDKGEKMLQLIIKCIDDQTDEKDECVSAKNGFDCFVTTGKKDGILHF